jgi:hypothetical protein
MTYGFIFMRDRLFDSILNSINSPVLNVVIHTKEIIIINLLKTLPLSPKIIFMIALFL